MSRPTRTALSGTVFFCVPVGLIAFTIFYFLRAPLCYALPEPHRSALTPLATTRFRLTTPTLLVLLVSVLLGAWTHTVADSLTHRTGWIVQRVPWMQTTLFHIGQADFPVHQLLQHAGSTLGSIALVAAYLFWLRRQPRSAPKQRDAIGDGTRVLIIVGSALIALAVALPLGWQATSHFAGYTRLRASGFQSAIYAAQIFVPLFVTGAVVIYVFQTRTPGSGQSLRSREAQRTNHG